MNEQEMREIEEDRTWWEVHANIVLLVRWMADEDYDSDQIAYAVEKPWKHKDEFERALIARDEDQERQGL